MDVGLELRQARERRELTLQQLSGITKISVRVLRAIEACDDSVLPAAVYTRGFVKSYAREVGLRADETLCRYMAQFAPPEDADLHGPVAEPPRTARGFDLIDSIDKLIRGPFAAPGAIVMVVVMIVAMTIAQRDRTAPPARSPQPAATAARLVPAAAPQEKTVGTAGTAPAGALHLTIVPTGACWMRAAAGDKQLFAGLLQPGERRTVDATSEITLRIGDPAACAFTINGVPARLAGTPGHAVTARITTDNYREFTSAK